MFVEADRTPRDIVDSCEEQAKLFSYKGLFIASVRTTYQSYDCIRIVFVIKESDSGKVKDIDKIFDLISDLEQALISIDKCEQSKADGFIYLDIIKMMIPED